MSKLDALKIKECPYAFASFAEKHNALVDMLAAMQGQNGVTVVMAEKNAIIRGSLGNVANVVTSDGSLRSVYVSAAASNAFPTHLQTGASSADRSIMEPTEVSVVNAAGTEYAALTAAGIEMRTSGGVVLELLHSALGHNMSIKTIDVCVDNVTYSMDILASDPY